MMDGLVVGAMKVQIGASKSPAIANIARSVFIQLPLASLELLLPQRLKPQNLAGGDGASYRPKD